MLPGVGREEDDACPVPAGPGQVEPRVTSLDAAWPEEIYSLSHIALPFRRDDPLYGDTEPPGQEPWLQLGGIAPRGERGVLRIPADEVLRMRWNPFYPWLEEWVLELPDHAAYRKKLGPRLEDLRINGTALAADTNYAAA